MNGALLSEVWPDMVQKPQKRKRKKKTNNNSLMNPPMTPNEMESELLDDDIDNKELDSRRKLKGMNISPYTDNEIHYQDTKKVVDLELNDNIVRPDKTREYKKSYEDDPEYQEFLEFKRMKERKRNNEIKQENKLELIDQNQQFNELLLYVFTGFFLLMIYDNIYKLGKDSY